MPRSPLSRATLWTDGVMQEEEATANFRLHPSLAFLLPPA